MLIRALSLFGIASSALSGCSQNSRFKPSKDPSAEVHLKSVGMNTSPDGKPSSQEARINIDCFIESLDAERANDGSPIKSLGIPSNCPKVSDSSNSIPSPAKHDVAIVLDTSENMIPFIASAKKELALTLKKLLTEQRIGSLVALAFRGGVTAVEKGADHSKTIELITGDSADWIAQALKVIDPTSTDWITNDAAKDVFSGLQQAASHLKAGENSSKILVLLTASTAKSKGISGFDVAPGATVLADLQSSTISKGGQLVFGYAASDKLARGLSEYAPHSFDQLNSLSSVAAINPVRAIMPTGLDGWGDTIVKRSSTPATDNESCILAKLEGYDAAEGLVFKKDFAVKEKNGLQEATLPKVLQGVSFSLRISRKCEKSGEKTQTVLVKAAQERIKK